MLTNMSTRTRKRKMPFPVYGETNCEKKGCRNKAYFALHRQLLCGVHSRKFKKERKELIKDKDKLNQIKAAKQLAHEKTIQQAARENRGKRLGDVIVTKLRMLKTPELKSGYLQCWPSYRHDLKEGFGCSALSPMRLYAKNHGEYLWKDQDGKFVNPGQDGKFVNPTQLQGLTKVFLPDSPLIENYHQQTKLFAEENALGQDGYPTQSFWDNVIKRYADQEPHRHKIARRNIKGKNKNVPLFSCRPDKNGVWRKLSYIESRWFYCSMYEKAVQEQTAFRELQTKRRNGTNLEIIGYDGYPITQTLYEHYTDGSKPFGHEVVLACILTVENEAERPWHIYRRNHPEVYDDFL